MPLRRPPESFVQSSGNYSSASTSAEDDRSSSGVLTLCRGCGAPRRHPWRSDCRDGFTGRSRSHRSASGRHRAATPHRRLRRRRSAGVGCDPAKARACRHRRHGSDAPRVGRWYARRCRLWAVRATALCHIRSLRPRRATDLPCSPCNRIRQPPARCLGHTPDCLAGVTTDAVLAAAIAVLDESVSRMPRSGRS